MLPAPVLEKQIVDGIKQIGNRHSIWVVFEDFLAMAALAISNAFDKVHWEDREKKYLKIVKKYSKEELNLLCSVNTDLVLLMEIYKDNPKDVLGPIFHDLELHNKYQGQFFTPNEICEMIGMLADSGSDQDILADRGFVTLNEPCSGSGAMALGFARAAKKKGISFHTQLCIYAQDIDLKCVYMCYIQLSMYGIPAVVEHANSLTLESWSRWYTPVYIVDDWIWRASMNSTTGWNIEDEKIKCWLRPEYKFIRYLSKEPAEFSEQEEEIEPIKKKFDFELNQDKNGQFKFSL